MLTKKLLETRQRNPKIWPVYRPPEEYRNTAAAVLDAYRPGVTKAQLDETLRDAETHETYTLVRGLRKLLDRRLTFDCDPPVDPEELREAAFERGFVTEARERRAVMDAVGDLFGISGTEVSDSLWADSEREQRLRDAPAVAPADLLRQYNLALTGTFLCDAVSLTVQSRTDLDRLAISASELGVMVEYRDGMNALHVVGPAAVDRKYRTYRKRVAEWVGHVVAASEWTLRARVEVEVRGETRLYEFAVDSTRSDLFPLSPWSCTPDDDRRARFTDRIESRLPRWRLRPGPTVVRGVGEARGDTGESDATTAVVDFIFERPYSGRECYLAVFDCWTPEFLENRLTALRSAAGDRPVVAAVNERRCCASGIDKEALRDGLASKLVAERATAADAVVWFPNAFPVEAVAAELDEFEQEFVRADREYLFPVDLDAQSDALEVDAFAYDRQVEPEAVRRHALDTGYGVLSNGTYLPERLASELRTEIDALDRQTVDAVRPLLGSYDVGTDALAALGYVVEEATAERATVRRQEAD
ncbi:hypothetical protein AUR64_17525 [Haloprofundus marisrubri]|uniref:DUF790 family protein n=1 Tax=Haloprofundus marisrubri TaxID=1514971 RepID=A0A0W1R5B0_9EURY|nr:DUF790 family protein [Haloprofundus marisrubri]KTG08484.1 hypothetical protein AUR64_17525 [Haloprofundus marisrubri]